MKRIVVVDDDIKIRQSVQLIINNGYELEYAKEGIEALKLIFKKSVDLVLLDIGLPGQYNGIDILKRIKDKNKSIKVVMISATNTAKMAVKALKYGAEDYITKPFDPSFLKQYITDTVTVQPPKKAFYKLTPINLCPQNPIIGQSVVMQELLQTIHKICQFNSTICIQGESGTGKELVARTIHINSPRKDNPFIAVNCAAIPESLLEMEFFGYEKGAFTNADYNKPGKFELAHNGTLFLDEIAALKYELQGKLLRVLQEREYMRIGGTQIQKVDVRIISASNQDLSHEVETGQFRKDLYYRLDVLPIQLPSLRDHKEDIPLLASRFIQLFCRKYNKNISEISHAAMEYLMGYTWPGNVRELENVIERMVALGDTDRIEAGDLPFELLIPSFPTQSLAPSSSNLLKQATTNFERHMIFSALKKTKGNQTKAAQLLGIHRNTLIQKISQLKGDEQ